jgi:hypothetical protein
MGVLEAAAARSCMTLQKMHLQLLSRSSVACSSAALEVPACLTCQLRHTATSASGSSSRSSQAVDCSRCGGQHLGAPGAAVAGAATC